MNVNETNKTNKHTTEKTTTPVDVSKEVPKTANKVDPKGGATKDNAKVAPTTPTKMHVDPKTKH